MKIGVICPSEIAIRRFMPALKKVNEVEFVGVAINSICERYGNIIPEKEIVNRMLETEREKADQFINQYGGMVFDSYESIVTSKDIDAIYIPLPPALHYKWAKAALKNGKHVLVEKPATTSADMTKELIKIADENGLAFHENYMFSYHKQLDYIDNIVKSGEIGEVRLYRISFGFPLRQANDFRYNKELGGGALIDAGGYTIKYASRLLGETCRLAYAHMNYTDEYEVDMYGSAALINANGTTVQVAFGMDNNYKCELEVWGSKGCLTTGRVLTAPSGFEPTATIRKGNNDEIRNLPADDAFEKSIEKFLSCIVNKSVRKGNYEEIIRQAELVDKFRQLAEKEFE